jgi:hypothetical protein
MASPYRTPDPVGDLTRLSATDPIEEYFRDWTRNALSIEKVLAERLLGKLQVIVLGDGDDNGRNNPTARLIRRVAADSLNSPDGILPTERFSRELIEFSLTLPPELPDQPGHWMAMTLKRQWYLPKGNRDPPDASSHQASSMIPTAACRQGSPATQCSHCRMHTTRLCAGGKNAPGENQGVYYCNRDCQTAD